MKTSTLLPFLSCCLLAAPASAALTTITFNNVPFRSGSGMMGGQAPPVFASGDMLTFSVTYDTSIAGTASSSAAGFFTDFVNWSNNPITNITATVARGGLPIYQANVSPNLSASPGGLQNNITYAETEDYSNLSLDIREPGSLIPDASYASPTGSQTVQFTNFSMTLANQSGAAGLMDIEAGNTYTIGQIIGDGSTFGPNPGTLGGLAFVIRSNGDFFSYNFSTNSVPEPSAACLGALAALTLARRRR